MLQINIKPNSISILTNPLRQFHFDYSGRLIGHFDSGNHYRVGLDGNIVFRSGDERLLDRFLEKPEVEHQFGIWLAEWKTWPEEPQTVTYFEADAIDVHLFLNQISVKGESRLNDSQNFRHIWGRIPILPPEFYQSMVINLTSGCSHNECTFCTFYKQKPYSVRTQQELSVHLKEIEDFFGAGITARRDIFLGEANAMTVPQPRLVSLMQTLNDWKQEIQLHNSGLKINRIGSFIDGFTGIHKTVGDWKELRLLGLTDIALGIESGSLQLLGQVGKPIDFETVKEIVNRIKQAELNVQLIFLLGLGGREHRKEHFYESFSLIRLLQLNSLDRIQLSFLNPDLIDDGYPFATDIMTEPELEQEYQLWKKGLMNEQSKVEVRKYPTQLFVV